jgi:hypothetical protein
MVMMMIGFGFLLGLGVDIPERKHIRYRIEK